MFRFRKERKRSHESSFILWAALVSGAAFGRSNGHCRAGRDGSAGRAIPGKRIGFGLRQWPGQRPPPEPESNPRAVHHRAVNPTSHDPTSDDPTSHDPTAADPTAVGVASVMSVIRPGKDAHRIVGTADSQTYGLDRPARVMVSPG